MCFFPSSAFPWLLFVFSYLWFLILLRPFSVHTFITSHLQPPGHTDDDAPLLQSNMGLMWTPHTCISWIRGDWKVEEIDLFFPVGRAHGVHARFKFLCASRRTRSWGLPANAEDLVDDSNKGFHLHTKLQSGWVALLQLTLLGLGFSPTKTKLDLIPNSHVDTN